MNAPSKDIADILEAYGESSGLPLTFLGNLFTGQEPSLPLDCVTILDGVGYPPYLGLTSKGFEYPSVQIRVRNSLYAEGWTIANDIKDALHGTAQLTINGTLYSLIQCINGPTHIDWDERNCAIFVVNFNIQRRASG